ncbi:MAG: sigma-70 family RNA polymerase sigma factor [Nitrospirae bacterium]|nr:MAG: sigma-70 family RNA polymerase sigma factor [Nitrospirota bacterium]
MELPPQQTVSTIDPLLIAKIAKGDQQAFSHLYDQSSTLLFTLAVRILGDRNEAAALLQELYLEIWRKVARYDVSRGTPIAWLVALTRSRAIARLPSLALKGHGKTGAIDDREEPTSPDQTSDAFETDADRERRALVKKAVAELPEAQQQVLELAYYGGLSYQEIAARRSEPIGTIKTQISLGLSTLKTALRPCWGPS